MKELNDLFVSVYCVMRYISLSTGRSATRFCMNIIVRLFMRLCCVVVCDRSAVRMVAHVPMFLSGTTRSIAVPVKIFLG